MERLGSGAANSMTISVNGESADARGAGTIEELIDRYGLPPQTVLIEHNGLALHRREWADRKLADGDRIEILRVVAGG
jgi:sulfur carrier protein